MSDTPTLVTRLASPPRRDVVTVAIGIWLVAAVFSDGWAHFNVPELESFFTPWHLALYAGFGAMVAWLGVLGWQARAAGGVSLRDLPVGYRGAALGVAIFGVGGVTDLLWHEIFGVEIAIDALLSPSHLLLGLGGLLILTSPIRAQGLLSPTAARAWTPSAVASLVLSTALVAFFLLYTSPFAMPAPVLPFTPTPEGSPGHLEAELPVVAALAGYLVSTVMIAVPLLLILRSGHRAPRAAVSILVGTIALLSVAVVDFTAIAVAGAVGAIVGAVVADLALHRTRILTAPQPWGLPVVAAGVAVAVCAGQLAGLALGDALRWPPSLWFGLIVLTGLTASAIGLLARPLTSS